MKEAKQEIKTVKVRRSTLELLSKLKIHPRQPYEEVILKFINANENGREKSEW